MNLWRAYLLPGHPAYVSLVIRVPPIEISTNAVDLGDNPARHLIERNSIDRDGSDNRVYEY